MNLWFLNVIIIPDSARYIRNIQINIIINLNIRRVSTEFSKRTTSRFRKYFVCTIRVVLEPVGSCRPRIVSGRSYHNDLDIQRALDIDERKKLVHNSHTKGPSR